MRFLNIGNILLLILASIIGYRIWVITRYTPRPSLPGLLVPQDVSKSRFIQSKTGDASMATESVRRRAIGVHKFGDTLNFPKKAIRETRTSSGSYTGYLEAFMLTSIFGTQPPLESVIPPQPPEPPFPTTYTVFDGLHVDNTGIKFVLDANGDIAVVYDGGNA